MTQKAILTKLFEDNPDKKFFTYEMQKVETKYGWLGSQADRIARTLFKEGVLDREPRGQYEVYWLKNPKMSKTPQKPTFQEVERNGQRVMLLVN